MDEKKIKRTVIFIAVLLCLWSYYSFLHKNTERNIHNDVQQEEFHSIQLVSKSQYAGYANQQPFRVHI